MPTETSGLGFRIPDSSDDARDGAVAIANLGADLDGHLTPTLIAETVDLTPRVNWQLDTCTAYRAGSLVLITGTVTYQGASAQSIPASGNPTNIAVADMPLTTPNGYVFRRPIITQGLGTAAIGRTAGWELRRSDTAGMAAVLWLANVASGADIAVGEQLSFSGLYLEEPAP